MNDIGTLINTLYHPDETIRAQAEASLLEVGPAALAPLIEVLAGRHQPPKIRAATGWLRLGPSPKAIETDARRRAAALLQRQADPQAAEALHLAARDNTDESVRQAAAVALGERGDRRAVDPLIETLYSLDFETRARAAELLGQLGSRQSVDALIRVMLTDGQPSPRWQAMRALGRLGDPRAVQSITAVLQTLLALPAEDWALPAREFHVEEELAQPIWTTCHYALEALGNLGSPQALPVLERLARDAPPRTIRDKAERCIARIRIGHTE